MQILGMECLRNASLCQDAARAAQRERSLLQTREASGFMVFGIEKNDWANITEAELEAKQELGNDFLAGTFEQLAEAIQSGALVEICNGNQKQTKK